MFYISNSAGEAGVTGRIVFQKKSPGFQLEGLEPWASNCVVQWYKIFQLFSRADLYSDDCVVDFKQDISLSQGIHTLTCLHNLKFFCLFRENDTERKLSQEGHDFKT